MSRRMDKRRTTRIKPRRQGPGKAVIFNIEEGVSRLRLSENERSLLMDCLRKNPRHVDDMGRLSGTGYKSVVEFYEKKMKELRQIYSPQKKIKSA